LNNGVPVFDSTKGNGNNDTHIIIAISTAGLFSILPLQWLDFRSQVLSDCSILLNWRTAHEENVLWYMIERSADGRNFTTIDSLPAGSNTYLYTDRNFAEAKSRIYYRVAVKEIDGSTSFSSVQSGQLCGHQQNPVSIYPTLVQNSFVISGLNPEITRDIHVEVADAAGKRIAIESRPVVFGSQTVYLERKPAPGTYFVIVKDNRTGKVLLTQKIIIGY
jgi:hypothetical protein